MKNKILIGLTAISSLIWSQNTVGTINLSDAAYDGYTLFTSHQKTFLINNCGQVVNEWTSDYLPGVEATLFPNGNLLRAGRLEDGSSSIGFGGQGGIIEIFDWDGNRIWSYVVSSENERQHHDVYAMPNGNVLIVSATVVSAEEAIELGRDPNLLEDNELYNERIFEVEPVGPDSGNVVWEWNAIDHLIQDIDSSKDNFGVISEHPEKININYLNAANSENNWLHINSIQYYEPLDQIVISSRNLSEIWIIDHSTSTEEAASSEGGVYGKGGDLLYRWGNPEAYAQGTDEDRKLFGQHFPYLIPQGYPNEAKLIVFNNGYQRDPDFSQVDLIEPATSLPGFYVLENGLFLPSEPEYTYSDQSSDPSDFFSEIVSSAQQLPNGNILICEGSEGRFFEISSSEELVWEYLIPFSNADGSIVEQGTLAPPNGFAFRAVKYPIDFIGFQDKQIEIGDPIELNFNLDNCNNLSIASAPFEDLRLSPNPSQGAVEIISNEPIEKVEVFDILGHKVSTSYSHIFDIATFKSGMYLVRITSSEGSITKKILKP